jgi:HD-like signal output (HDOD) protein
MPRCASSDFGYLTYDLVKNNPPSLKYAIHPRIGTRERKRRAGLHSRRGRPFSLIMPIASTAPAPCAKTTGRAPPRTLEERIAGGTLDVPVFPEAARQLLGACDRDDCDVARLAELVRRDPALAAHFLRVANSALFGGRSAISSLAQALARLGSSQTRSIALLVTTQARVFSSKTRASAGNQLRRQSVANAVWSQEIARLRRLNVEEAFLCGLLGDMGIPALWQLADEDVPANGVVRDETAIDHEIARLHDVVSARIARAWGLPPRVVEIIRLHHAPLEGPDAVTLSEPAVASTVAAVQLADMLGRATVRGETCDLATTRAHPSVAALSLYDEDVSALLERSALVAEAIQVLG